MYIKHISDFSYFLLYIETKEEQSCDIHLFVKRLLAQLVQKFSGKFNMYIWYKMGGRKGVGHVCIILQLNLIRSLCNLIIRRILRCI